jgi:cytidylate kinase
MAVLTISREIGSQGAEIGRMVAEKLNYHFADKQVMLNVFHQYGFKPFDKVYDKPTSFWDQFDSMRKMTLENLNSVIEALAHHGNMVIVGRGSFAVLQDLADVLNVRVQAPFDARLAWFMKEENLTDEYDAAERLEDMGIQRAAFVESTYKVPWDAASIFDMVINTGKVSVDHAVEWLVEAVSALAKDCQSGEDICRELTVEDYLISAVQGALECRDRH